MSDKRMLILPVELVEKVNANRGDMSQAEFINFLIDSHLNRVTAEERYVTREAQEDFERGIKDMLRSFLEFFVSYSMEMGGGPNKDDLEAISLRLGGLEGSRGKKPKA